MVAILRSLHALLQIICVQLSMNVLVKTQKKIVGRVNVSLSKMRRNSFP